MSYLSAMQISASGLQAQQTVLEVAGNNIANVNTPGYHRQEAVLNAVSLAPATPQGVPTNAVLGSGVDVTTIQRLQSQYLTQQQQQTTGQMSYWNAQQNALSQAQSVLEPSATTDLSTQLNSFFSAWQQLANSPGDATSRTTVVYAAQQVATTLNSNATYLNQTNNALLAQEGTDVQSLNSMATQLATLNGQISQANGSGIADNNLLDQRDTLTQQMAGLAGVTVTTAANGTAMVNLGGHQMVSGTTTHVLTLDSSSGSPKLTWDDGTSAQIPNGEIAGLENTRGSVLSGFSAKYDALASALSSAVNTQYAAGVKPNGQPAGAFFTGTTAGTLQVSAAILADPSQVAAGATANAPGDGSVASAIANLANQPLIGASTVQQGASALVGQIGTSVQNAQNMVNTTQAVQDQLTSQQQSVSGVSLDEELTNMMTAQQAYDASARVMTTADQMMQSLLSTIQTIAA